MKSNVLSITIVMLLITQTVISQDILIVIEKDRDGRYLDRNDSIKDSYINNRIADINSVLDIKIDRNALTEKISTIYQKSLPDELSVKISRLRTALETRNQALSRINEIIKCYDYEIFKTNPDVYDQCISDVQKAVNVVFEIKQIDPRINKEARRYENLDSMFIAVYYAAEIVLAEITDDIKDFAEEEGVRIQLGGWLATKNENIPIHLEGFDDIAPQSPYEVERWQFIPTPEQLKELEKIKELAKENRDMGTNILKEIAQNQLNALKSFGQTALHNFGNRLETELQRVESQIGDAIDPKLIQAAESVSDFTTDFVNFTQELNSRLDFYKTISITNENEVMSLVKHALDDIRYVAEGDGKNLFNKIGELSSQLAQLDEAIASTFTNIKMIVNDLKNEYTSEFNSIVAFTINKEYEKLIAGRQLDIKALEFGDDVYRLTLANLPESTELDLINTGYRTDGDRLAIKMAVSDKSSAKPVTVDTREIYLFKVLPHIISTVGVVFCDPLANTAIEAQFQMAPSYSILFKGLTDQRARRNSVTYNKLLDWGFGIHIAAPDFDKDDVPEITAGIVVSCLHDYMQSGFAFNLFTGDPYWFFGLRFPIPAFGMSASSKVQME